jgi:hypothetical protein
MRCLGNAQAKMKIIVTAGMTVLSLAVSAQAQIGRTLDESKRSYGYGKIFLHENIYIFCGPKTDFHRVRYFITAFFVEGKVSLVYYTVNDPSADKMYTEDAKDLLKNSAPEVVWSDPSANAENTEMTWSGSINGVVHRFGHGKHIFIRCCDVEKAAKSCG